MTSLPSIIEFEQIQQRNEDKFLLMLAKLDPELYLIRQQLRESSVNPVIMPRVIRAIANLADGVGYGKVTIFMQNFTITAVEATEHDRIDQSVKERGDE